MPRINFFEEYIFFCLSSPSSPRPMKRGDEDNDNNSDTDGNNNDNIGDHDNNDNDYSIDGNRNTSNSNDRSSDFNNSDDDKANDDHRNDDECCSFQRYALHTRFEPRSPARSSPLKNPELQRKNNSPNLLFSEVDERGTKRKSKRKRKKKILAYIPFAFSGVANLLLVSMLLRFLCLFLGIAKHTLV